MEKSESIFINRELSWLDFDSRVLALAKEKTVPLGERLKFAAIFGSNMGEFFMVRVGSLYDQTLVKNNKTDNVTHMCGGADCCYHAPRGRAAGKVRQVLPASCHCSGAGGLPQGGLYQDGRSCVWPSTHIILVTEASRVML